MDKKYRIVLHDNGRDLKVQWMSTVSGVGTGLWIDHTEVKPALWATKQVPVAFPNPEAAEDWINAEIKKARDVERNQRFREPKEYPTPITGNGERWTIKL